MLFDNVVKQKAFHINYHYVSDIVKSDIIVISELVWLVVRLIYIFIDPHILNKARLWSYIQAILRH